MQSWMWGKNLGTMRSWAEPKVKSQVFKRVSHSDAQVGSFFLSLIWIKHSTSLACNVFAEKSIDSFVGVLLYIRSYFSLLLSRLFLFLWFLTFLLYFWVKSSLDWTWLGIFELHVPGCLYLSPDLGSFPLVSLNKLSARGI